MRMRVTAMHVDTGEIRTLATARSPKNLVMRIVRDEGLWDRLGWEAFQIEDKSIGSWTQTLREHLDQLRAGDEIDRITWKTLRGMAG